MLSGLENENAPASSWPRKISRPSVAAVELLAQRVGLDLLDDRRLAGDPHQHVAVERGSISSQLNVL